MQNIPRHEDEFFILLERVGTKGRYQRYLFCLFFTLWFTTAFIILSPAFLLLPNKFTCESYPDQDQCNQYVCQLPEDQWHKYELKPILNSLITQFEDHHCGKEPNTSVYKMMLFGGIFVGYMIFMHFSDNMGRRFGMIITSITSTLGFIIISLSSNIWWACFGLLLAGAGCESNMRINLSIMNQMVDYNLRQKYSLILQCSFGIGGICVALGYYYLRDWRTVNTYFCTIPSIICLVVIVLYLEETPNHMMKQGSRAMLGSLERIAAINRYTCSITEYDVMKVIQLRQENSHSSSRKVTFSIPDLFRFKSLKKNTFHLFGIFFFVSALYIGPSSAIDKFNLNIFLLQGILSISECVAYPIACVFIHQTKRKRIGIKCFALCAAFNFMAYLVPSGQCDYCISNFSKIFLMFCSRYCVAYYYGVLFIYVVEIYPEQIRTIGFGTVSAVGALGALATQKVIQVAEQHSQDPLVYFTLFACLCIYFTVQLPETHGVPLQVQIEELRAKKPRISYEPTTDISLDLSMDEGGETLGGLEVSEIC